MLSFQRQQHITLNLKIISYAVKNAHNLSSLKLFHSEFEQNFPYVLPRVLDPAVTDVKEEAGDPDHVDGCPEQ